MPKIKQLQSVSRVFTITTDGVNDSGGLGDKPGLVTQFTFGAEPRSMFLLLGVLVGVTRRPNPRRVR